MFMFLNHSFIQNSKITIFYAKVKAGGSTKNGRDSISKRLGVKACEGQWLHAGSIIYRQRGTKIHPGNNVKRGKDDTLFSIIDGYVKFERINRKRRQVSVYPKRV